MPKITVPTLVTAMGAHYFIRDSEIHYEKSAARDKDLVVIERATHNLAPCTACETTPGQYGNSQRNFFDYVTRSMRSTLHRPRHGLPRPASIAVTRLLQGKGTEASGHEKQPAIA